MATLPPPIKTIKEKIVTHLKRNGLLINLLSIIRSLPSRDFFCKRAKVINNGRGTIKKMIKGRNNTIIIGNNTYTKNTLFHIRGENNIIEIGDNCYIGEGCSFWMEGFNIRINIGANTTFTQLCHFNAQEKNSVIHVGKGCMFSNHIIVRTSDAHPIYDIISSKRINTALPVLIGDNVWIAPDTKIMKGANIGNGCIIGSNTMVNKEIPNNCLAVGMPAKVVKRNVRWTREDIIFQY